MFKLDAILEYRVKFGDTLETLGQRFYGDPALGLAIYQANRHYIQNSNQLTPGQMLAIPHLNAARLVLG